MGLSSDDSIRRNFVPDISCTDGDGAVYSIWSGSLWFQTMVKAGYSVSAGRDSQDSDYYLYAYTCYQDGKTGKAIEGSNLAADLWYDTGGCGFCFYG